MYTSPNISCTNVAPGRLLSLGDQAPLAATGVQPILTMSTAGLPAEQQFDAWNEQYGSVIEMLAPADKRGGYPMSCTIWKLGPFALGTVQAPASRYRRTRSQVRRDALDQWVINLVRRGSHYMRTEQAELAVSPGLPYIFSFADAFEGERTDIDWLCLFIPRETYPELGPAIDRCRYQPMYSGMGLLLADYLNALERQLPGVTQAELPSLAAATRAVVASCINPASHDHADVELHLQQARLERVRQVIQQNLRSPTLTPKRISRLVGMSRSQLYRLFEPVGGVARYIQRARLREACRVLSDAEDCRDIQDVAEDLGFFDPSSFSRAFRQEYGCSPREVRIGAQAGARTTPARLAPGALPPADFATLLRSL